MGITATGQRNPLGKAFHLLRWLLDSPAESMGVHEIASGTGMSPSTVHRLLKSLESEGLVRGDASGHYGIGLEFYRLGWQARARYPLNSLALPVLQRLVSRCDETAFLGVYDAQRLELLITSVVDGTNPLRFAVPINQWLPLFYGSSGLGIMAFLPESERQQIMDRMRFSASADRFSVHPVLLEMELERTRQRGYSLTRGHRIPGAVGITAPFWGPGQRVLGGLNITFPEYRVSSEAYDHLSKLVVEHAAEITDLIGGKSAAHRI